MYDAFLNICFEILAEAKVLLCLVTASPSNSDLNSKLLHIENCLKFRATFSDLVHGKSEISDVQKLHYSKAAFVGEAAGIKSLEFMAKK